jgi:hypothetical protein
MKIIVGDSWGVGEWGTTHGNYEITGPGFAQYLSLRDQVCNLSVGGASNADCVARLESFLQRYHLAPSDQVFFVVTDPKRQLLQPALISWVQNVTGTLHEQIAQMLQNQLQIIDDLAAHYKIKINLIAGFIDLVGLDWNQYANLNVFVDSWIRLHVPTYQPSILNKTWWPEIGEIIKHHRPDLLEEWIELSNQISKRWAAMSSSLLFQEQNITIRTDGLHPTRYSHQQLALLLD